MAMARVLNVAEKPSVAKEVSRVLSNGGARSSPGRSQYNTVWEFPLNLRGQQVIMVFTSVTGHLMEMDFPTAYRKWRSCAEEQLFTLDVSKSVRDANARVKDNLVHLARSCDRLMLWLDCDREGENIAYEVIEVCCRAKAPLRHNISRAHFSSLNPQELWRAVQGARAPDENQAKAVDARQEIDLRVGAAFTRFQTMLLQNRFEFPDTGRGEDRGPLLSYGPCQFPTLGFLVERQWEIDAHDAEEFWAIRVSYEPPPPAEGSKKPPPVRFNWQRGRLYDHLVAVMIFEMCVENPMATVVKVDERDEHRRPPPPLNTVALTKLASTTFRISGKKCMDEAEKLYQQGYISYPRTETNIFSPETDLMAMVQGLAGAQAPWANYAQGLANGRFVFPQGGGETDNAHPPIHPVRFDKPPANAPREAQQIYELVCRHFLACCSPPAMGARSIAEIDIAAERFTARGLMVHDRSFLDVYPYMRWSDSAMPSLAVGDTFQPSELNLDEGQTQPPPLLSEADLISLMDSNGIGTDATMHAHIDTIVERSYAERDPNGRMKPTRLGMALVQAYAALDLQLWKPYLRAQMEKDLNDVAAGRKTKESVTDACLNSLKNAFLKAKSGSRELVSAVGEVFEPKQGGGGGQGGADGGAGQHVGGCKLCQMPMLYKHTANGSRVVGCTGYPQCRNSVWLPSCATKVELTDQLCEHCANARGNGQGRQVFMFSMEFPRRVLPPQYRDKTEYLGCVLCNSRLRELCDMVGGPPGNAGGGGGGGSGVRSDGGGRGRGRGRSRSGRIGGRGGGGSRSGQYGGSAAGASSSTCFKCGQSGHFAADCPNA